LETGVRKLEVFAVIGSLSVIAFIILLVIHEGNKEKEAANRERQEDRKQASLKAKAEREEKAAGEKKEEEMRKLRLGPVLADFQTAIAIRGGPSLSVDEIFHSQRVVQIDANQALLFVQEATSTIQVISYFLDEELHIHTDLALHQGDVLTVETEIEQIAKTRSKQITTPVPVQTITQTGQNRSALGRGIVGAAVLGPAGGVIGAVSGLDNKTSLNSKTEIIEHKSYVKEDYTVEGRAFLVVGIRNFKSPILKLEFVDRQELKEWYVRFLMFKGE
jgi:hypothetical protein